MYIIQAIKSIHMFLCPDFETVAMFDFYVHNTRDY